MMSTIEMGQGKRHSWEFEYTAAKLADGAKAQLKFRKDKVEWWTGQKAKVMDEVRESGIEVSESVGALVSNYTRGHGPQVMIRTDLQTKLTECHGKVQEHQQAADEYEGWIQALEANPEARFKLTVVDWLYFFGKVSVLPEI